MKGNRKNWITVWLVVLCAAWLVTGTYAAYTKVDSIKRVVSTTTGLGARFSSNHMTVKGEDDNASGYNVTAIPVTSTTGVSVATTVCNFPQGDAAKWNPNDITYTFSAALLDTKGNPITASTQLNYRKENGTNVTGEDIAKELSITSDSTHYSFIDNSGYALTIGEQSLLTGEARQNVYKLTFNGEAAMLAEVMIQIKATPTDPTACGLSDGQFLAGRLRIVASSAQSTQWKGSFTEWDNGIDDPKTLDAFNYEISGTEQGTYRLTWNPAHVEISHWFLEDLGKTQSDVQTDESGKKYIEFEVGGVGQPTSYRFVFYRTKGVPEEESWNRVQDYVTFIKPAQ